MFTKALFVSVFAAFAVAQKHAPVGDPKGNPISRPLNEVVPACKPFTITWTPTTPNTVSVLLLKGPSTNVVKFGPSLAEGITNSGSLAWTPASDLPTTDGPTGYGIQIIDDVTGQYQYSTQFGISKGDCGAAGSSSAAVSYPASSAAVSPSASPAKSSPAAASSSPCSTTPAAAVSTPVYASTGAPVYNTTVILPTGSMTVPSTLRQSVTATTSKLPEATTNAAPAMKAGLSLAGVAAVVAFVL